MPRYRLEPHNPESSPGGGSPVPSLESIEATFSDGGGEIFFVSGYSAREISQRHHNEHGGTIWVNSISRKVRAYWPAEGE